MVAALGAHLKLADTVNTSIGSSSKACIYCKLQHVKLLRACKYCKHRTPALNFLEPADACCKLRRSELCKELRHCQLQHLEIFSFVQMDGAREVKEISEMNSRMGK